ncbi:hypothetical protein HY025_05980 [Candidatus Daviesbacteria bacterium]|nr:hypothetical protein [Candidatus Daviesbacteria bacterium]
MLNINLRSAILSAAMIGSLGLTAVSPAFAVTFNQVQNQFDKRIDAVQNTHNLYENAKNATPGSITCDVSKRVDARIKNYDNRHNFQVGIYRTVNDRLTALVNKLQGKGYDQAKLNTLSADGKVMDTKIQTMNTDYASVIAKLKEAQAIGCSDSTKAEYKAKIQEAGQLLKQVFADAQAIKAYWKGTIKPDMEAVRDSKPKTSASVSGSNAQPVPSATPVTQ